MFENRIELFSPGMIANSLTVDSLRYRQSARNETICSLLAKCTLPDETWLVSGRVNIMEKRGEGRANNLGQQRTTVGQNP